MLLLSSQKSQDVDPMSALCWASILDGGPQLTRLGATFRLKPGSLRHANIIRCGINCQRHKQLANIGSILSLLEHKHIRDADATSVHCLANIWHIMDTLKRWLIVQKVTWIPCHIIDIIRDLIIKHPRTSALLGQAYRAGSGWTLARLILPNKQVTLIQCWLTFGSASVMLTQD